MQSVVDEELEVAPGLLALAVYVRDQRAITLDSARMIAGLGRIGPRKYRGQVNRTRRV